MKKLLIVGLVAVGGYLIHSCYFGEEQSGQTAAYHAFLKALRSARFSDAAQMIHGDQAENDLRAFKRRDAGLNRRHGALNIRRLLVREIDRETAGDTVYLTVEEEVRFDPPGAASAYGSANAWLLHKVEMVEVDGAWKVSSFQFEVDRAEGLDGIPVDEVSMWF